MLYGRSVRRSCIKNVSIALIFLSKLSEERAKPVVWIDLFLDQSSTFVRASKKQLPLVDSFPRIKVIHITSGRNMPIKNIMRSLRLDVLGRCVSIFHLFFLGMMHSISSDYNGFKEVYGKTTYSNIKDHCAPFCKPQGRYCFDSEWISLSLYHSVLLCFV